MVTKKNQSRSYLNHLVHVTVHRNIFLYQNQRDALISLQIYSWNETLHVSDTSSVHHQEYFTVHIAMVYVLQFCRQLASRIRMEHPDAARKLSAKLYDIYHEILLMMDRKTVRNM